MKRLYLAAVAGLCSVVPLSAQEGALAPTAPVVPAPVLQNGSLVAPGGNGWGAGSRSFAITRWSPFRNPATASVTEPVVPSAAAYGHALPPLPAGVSGATAPCGPAGCGNAGHTRGCWEHLKAWLCYHPSKTDMPKCRPTPYVTPLQGMFPCTSVAGCTTGCAVGAPAVGQPQPQGPQGPPMTPPVPPGTTAGAVMMPPRGPQGAATLQPTWQGRTTPAAQFAAKPTTGPVVGASLTYPAPK